MKYIVILIILFIIFSPKSKKKQRRKNKRVKGKVKYRVNITTKVVTSPVSYSLDDTRKYIVKNVPELLQDYNIFLPAFLSRFCAEFLENGTIAKFSNDDLLEGVKYDYAFFVLNKCVSIISARYSNIQTIKSASNAEAKYITVKVSRDCPSCSKVPKEKKYKVGMDVPIYPCLNCKEEHPCQIWYKLDF